MSKSKITVVGGCTEDIVVHTSEGVLVDNKKDPLRQKLIAFEYGAKIAVNKSYAYFGGGASNVSVSLAKLGFDVSILSSLGSDDRAGKILNNLQKHKVNTGLVQKKSGQSAFSFLIMGPDKEHVLFSDRGASSSLGIDQRSLRKVKNSDWVYISSLYGHWHSVLDKIFSTPKARIAWNPGSAQFRAGYEGLKKYFERVYLFSLNMDEALELVLSLDEYKSKGPDFYENPENLLRIIKDWGPQIVVITRGEEGAIAYDGKQFYKEDVVEPRRKEDTTGVGDAFASSFVAGLIMYKDDISRSMRLAMYNAASVIAEEGAQNGLLNKKNIPKIL